MGLFCASCAADGGLQFSPETAGGHDVGLVQMRQGMVCGGPRAGEHGSEGRRVDGPDVGRMPLGAAVFVDGQGSDAFHGVTVSPVSGWGEAMPNQVALQAQNLRQAQAAATAYQLQAHRHGGRAVVGQLG